MRTRELPVTRVTPDYAWGICMAIESNPRGPFGKSGPCGNTVKFGKPDSASVCPACGAGWHCSELEEE